MLIRAAARGREVYQLSWRAKICIVNAQTPPVRDGARTLIQAGKMKRTRLKDEINLKNINQY